MAANIPRWQAVSTVLIFLLAVLASASGFFRPGHYPPELLPGFYIQDAFILVVGAPALLLGFLATRRDSLRGRFVWLGALAYMTYMWASIALQVAFNQFFLAYIVLFGLSIYTLIGAISSTKQTAVRDALADRISERVYGGFLWIIAVGVTVLWLAELVPATLTGRPPLLVAELGPQALASHFIDLSVVVPAMAIAGTWLWQQRPWGYILGGTSLVFGAILAPTLTSMTTVIVATNALPVPLVAIIFTALPALLAVILGIKFIHTIDDSETASHGVIGPDKPNDPQ